MDRTGTLTAVLCALTVLCSCAGAQDEQREVPIIKQINRVNEDGTYTFGYEAADGSFKIETRDVLGNVKGMFGYVDDRGELKRVSYTANNGTGFQATGNIAATRRPVLIYRGIGGRSTTPAHRREEEEERSTTPAYGDYINGRRGYVTSTTEEPTTRPVRVLVTKRPLESQNTRNPNLIRRQLERERNDYSPKRSRYQNQADSQDQRELYRNQLLEQNNLKPEYSSTQRTRASYYAPVEEDYPDFPGAGIPPGLDRGLPQRLPPPPPPVPSRYRPYDDPYFAVPERRFPPVPFRRPTYDSYDYETFREAMNYLIQYLQYMRRVDPYQQQYPGYPGDYPVRPRLPIPPSGAYPSRGVPPSLPPVGGYPSRGVPPLPLPPVGGYPSRGVPPFPVPTPYSPYPGLPGSGTLGFGAPNIPYINSNVQYSSQEQAQTTAQEQLSNLKSRMDHVDQTDSADTRPPTSALIRMLLARPSTQRPAIRSVEILGTSSSSTSTTTSTTEQPDLMEASS